MSTQSQPFTHIHIVHTFTYRLTHPMIITMSAAQSWALSVFFNFFNNKK